MKRSTLFLMICIIVVCLSILAQAQENAVLTQAKSFFGPLPKVIESKDNPITPEKVSLGKMLFYDTRIAADKNSACVKCHWMNLYGADGMKTPFGRDCKPEKRNSLTVFNCAGQIAQHWPGKRYARWLRCIICGRRDRSRPLIPRRTAWRSATSPW